MRQIDPLTYRCPRTLEEAFGPGSRGTLNTDSSWYSWIDPVDRPVLLVIALAAISMAVASLIGLPA